MPAEFGVLMDWPTAFAIVGVTIPACITAWSVATQDTRAKVAMAREHRRSVEAAARRAAYGAMLAAHSARSVEVQRVAQAVMDEARRQMPRAGTVDVQVRFAPEIWVDPVNGDGTVTARPYVVRAPRLPPDPDE